MTDYKRDQKLEQLLILKFYAELERKPACAANAKSIKRRQDARVHDIMLRAAEYPFYQERFKQTGTTPDDYHCADDLYKFPVLTKDDLREWMDDELERYPEKYEDWHVSPTSGSTGRPLRVLQSPREHALWAANWLRTMRVGGFNPFTGKTMCRPNSLHARVDTSKADSPVQKLGILRRKYMSDTIWERVETQTLVDEINAYEPDYLYNHKNVLVRIAKYVKENDLYIWKPKFYSPVSEMLDEPYIGEKAVGKCDVALPCLVGEGEVFVMGDNRANSTDSRSSSVGCVDSSQVMGKVFVRVLPPGGIA